MKKVCMILVLCLLVMFPCCKKKLPTQADIPTKVLPTIEYFHATPEAISSGEVAILSWSVKNATNITINQDVGTVSAKDTVDVIPEETTTYTLTATNSDGQKTESCTVEVILNPPTIRHFTATPESIVLGEWSTLSWSTTDADTLRIEPLGDLTIPWAGAHPVSPTETTTYTLIAINDDGQTTASCTVEIKVCAVLEYYTDPEVVTFFLTEEGTVFADFEIVFKETNGIGGHLSDVRIETTSPACYNESWGGGTFYPFGLFKVPVSLVIPCKPIWLIVSWEGTDNSECTILPGSFRYLLWWYQPNEATAQIVKITTK